MINIIIFSDLGWNLPLTNNKMMSDASDMLAAALEQMDGIIAGNLHPLKDAVMAFTWLSWLFFLLQLFYYLSTLIFSFIGFLQYLSVPHGFSLCPSSPISARIILKFCLKMSKNSGTFLGFRSRVKVTLV